MSSSRANGHAAGQTGSLRRRRRPTNDEDGDEDQDGQPTNGSLSTNHPRTKRMRPSVGPDDDDDDDDDDDNDDDGANETYYSTTSGRRSGVNGTNGASGTSGRNGRSGGGASNGDGPVFQPGAIVRVVVENFVTYERAEFNPGPSLNMVIGPNGTGKSSLVCAICLGLGFHSNVLGRATAFSDFVKHGRSHAVVEIELQAGQEDLVNHVVRLRISREDNSRKFWINGNEVPLRRIQALMTQLRIQVDNLCQFLPQDRVAEFAGLNAVDLLAKTLEAAAPVDMKEMQAALKDVYHKQRDAEQKIQVDSEQLRVLESRHQAQQADVERYHEREEIQQVIDDLEACQPLVRFYEAKRNYSRLKSERREASSKLKLLEERVRPTLRAVNAKKAYKEHLEDGLRTRKAVLEEAELAVAGALQAVDRVETRFKETDNQRAGLGEVIEKKKKEISASRQKITILEAKHKNKPQDFVAADWNMKIREKEHQKREIEVEQREIVTDMDRIKQQAVRINDDMQKTEREMGALDSRRGQQYSILKRIAPQVARGWQYLEEHMHEFSKEIFGPPMMTCSVKDQRYSNVIQSLLQNDDFLCFTTQSVEDHKKLSQIFYSDMRLSVTIRTCTSSLSSFSSPFTASELSGMGFDGQAIDFIEGPDPVLAMLCAERRLHSSPISIAKPSQSQYEQIVSNERISTWAAKDQMYRVSRRREYGSHAVSTSVREIRPGRYWTEAQGGDVSERAELQAKLDELNKELEGLHVEMRALKAKASDPIRKNQEIDKEIEQLRSEKNALQSEYSKWQALPEKIEAENNTCNRLREEHMDLNTQRLSIIGQLDDLVLDKARAILRHAEHVGVLRAAYLSFMDVQVRAVEARSDFASLQAKNAHLAEQLLEKQRTLGRVMEEMQAQKAAGEEALEAAKGLMEDGSARSGQLHEMAQNKTLEDVRDEIAAERAKLELTRVVDSGVLEEYRRRARDIEQLRAALATHTAGVEGMGEQIAAIRGRWEPRLDELIGRINDAFSYNFEQINCAGEVSVHKDEDFDRWAIDIRVKFREHEELQKLDQHRQSGGERAVSTIFYLMSLQGMAQAPFRVVDEINQGMDPRNERMMHERMVEIACHEHASQYFLITPKLLPGLRYDENMTVLCIASGPHVPTNEARLDFRKCVQIQKQLMVAA